VHSTDDPPGVFQYLKGTDLELMPERERAKIDRKELVVPRGQLLTLSASEAVEYGFARKALSSRLALYDELGVKPGQVRRLYLTGSERLLTFLDNFSLLFLLGGLVLLFIEMQHPGFGLPGTIGLVCLGTFFVVKYTLHYAHLLEILLFVAGVVLLLIELLLIPGFGVVGGVGILLLFVSIVLMLQQFDWPASPSEAAAFRVNLLQAVGTFLAAVFGLMLLVRFLGSVPVLNRLVRRETMASARVRPPAVRAEEAPSQLVGEVGVALTPLRPAGLAQLGGQRVDVVTEGEFIERGTPVEVVAVRGTSVVVRRRERA